MLSADSILLEYSVSARGSKLWAITKDQAAVFRLPSEEAGPLLEKYLNTLRLPVIGGDEISAHIRLGTQLYQKLLGPAEKLIRGKTHLIIAPDGPLYYLPFEALIRPSSQKPGSAANANYLLKDFLVSYVPSASVLVTQQKSRSQPNIPKASSPLLAFGDPVYSSAGPQPNVADQPRLPINVTLRGLNLGPLEFSANEVRRIAGIWNVLPSSEHINLRGQATTDRLRKMDLAKYRIVHFAVHAVAGDQLNRMSQPALILSQGANDEPDTGLLQFSDILDLKLNADLVVLSACDTGLGRLRQGEGIVGLTRAFLYAGASSAVVSLWKVEDQSTSLLMEKFHRGLKDGKSKAEALRLAKLEMLNSTVNLRALGSRQSLAAPFYWASFVLVGDSGPLSKH